jgi:cytochrome b561
MVDYPRYHKLAILLHWLLAVALIGMLALGFWMEGVPKDPPGVRAGWFNLHKSIGIVIAWFILLRLLWRLTHRPPAWPVSMSKHQIKLAHLGHAAMYLCMVVLPLSGFLGSSFTPYPIKLFGLALPRLWDASPMLKQACTVVHTAAAYAMCALIAGHVAVAVRHALLRDGVMQRMMPAPKASRNFANP